ncbi:hypothetical protein HPB50_000309 [Hyalomma asiaticum]|uniref:Uncharacterized protein n=1 Tax=Hyalomma asiaticum TaxID=266040 RepID=A0ACB7RW16_HYAAI|nr:hypothetical protein HPB50_000309 [Hyalomma asiaticum]
MDLSKLRKPDLVMLCEEMGIEVATLRRKPLLIQALEDSAADEEELSECWELIQERMKRESEDKERETVRRKEEAEIQIREIERLRLQLQIVEARCASSYFADVPPGVKRQPRRRVGPLQDNSKFGQHKSCRVYVGDLGNRGNWQELEKAFGSYGPLRRVWVAQSPPRFAAVEFKDPQDAWDAVCAIHGETLCGRRVRVQLSTRKRRRPSRRLLQAELTGVSADTFQSTSACSVDVDRSPSLTRGGGVIVL